MFYWKMVNVEGGTWGKMRSSSFAHLSLSSYSETIMSFMMQFYDFRAQIITSCDEKESHAGDLGNLKVHLVLCTPEVQKKNFCCVLLDIQVTVFGEARIDIVDTSLTLGDGGAR